MLICGCMGLSHIGIAKQLRLIDPICVQQGSALNVCAPIRLTHGTEKWPNGPHMDMQYRLSITLLHL